MLGTVLSFVTVFWVRGGDWLSFTKKMENFTLEETDLVITSNQSQSNMIKVLFEPETKLSDSLTYDLTAWALPYVYGLQTYGLIQTIETSLVKFEADYEAPLDEKTYAYIAPWENVEDIRFLADLIKIAKNKTYDTYNHYNLKKQACNCTGYRVLALLTKSMVR